MENSFAYHLTESNPYLMIYYIHGLALLLCLLAMRGSENREDHALRILGSLIPFLGILFGVAALFEILNRTITSKGKCFAGHKFKHTYDSEAEKWKNGRMPIRLSVGGRDEYTCQNCDHQEIIRWSAF